MAGSVQRACHVPDLDAGLRRGHVAAEQRAGIGEANLAIAMNPEDSWDRSVKFYSRQSRQILGDKDDRVEVPILVHTMYTVALFTNCGMVILTGPFVRSIWLFQVWISTNLEPVQEYMYMYKVKIIGTGKMDAYTDGNILGKDSRAMIMLGYRFEDKPQTSVHELLHSLGFSHEHCRRDAHLYLKERFQLRTPEGYPNQKW